MTLKKKYVPFTAIFRFYDGREFATEKKLAYNLEIKYVILPLYHLYMKSIGLR
jgi:hypothetical protein